MPTRMDSTEHDVPVASGASRPSGWFRLWVVVVALYGLVVAGFVANAWPEPEAQIKTYKVREEATGLEFWIDYFGYGTQYSSPMTNPISPCRHSRPICRQNAASAARLLASCTSSGVV